MLNLANLIISSEKLTFIIQKYLWKLWRFEKLWALRRLSRLNMRLHIEAAERKQLTALNDQNYLYKSLVSLELSET